MRTQFALSFVLFSEILCHKLYWTGARRTFWAGIGILINICSEVGVIYCLQLEESNFVSVG